jgi:hypothetical protein
VRLHVNVGWRAVERDEFNVFRVGRADPPARFSANETKVGRVKIISVKGPRLRGLGRLRRWL